MKLRRPPRRFSGVSLLLAGALALAAHGASAGPWHERAGRPGPPRPAPAAGPAARPSPAPYRPAPSVMQAPQSVIQAPPRAAEPRSPYAAAQRAQELNGGGRVLSVEPGDNGYRVKLLKQGEMRVVNVPN